VGTLSPGKPTPNELRLRVREFLELHREKGTFTPSCDAWLTGFSPSFSAALGELGWIGVAWPREYGGRGLSQMHRFVVAEELLAAGAPVAAHWTADRQSGPTLLNYGTEAQRRTFLPGIAAGRLYFAIGMSESDSGSDLASVRTTARRTEGGWVITGRKLWTSHAHRADHMIALCRTAPADADRHAGLSQFVIDLHAAGIVINPIRLIDGGRHFNEVVLDDVALPEDALVGRLGQGWEQVTRELTFERGGPERYLSTLPLVGTALDLAEDSPINRQIAGRIVADLWSLRQLSLQILTETGDAPRQPAALSAAITKAIGTRLEQALIGDAARLVGAEPDPASHDEFQRLLAEAVLHSPGFTIRGGTTEVLRGVIAKMGGLA
jgi:acyl-CoA dehydrogenase